MKRTAEPTVIKTVSVSLLGGFALELDGTTLTDDINRSLKLWSVLAYLILHRDRPVPQTEFIETFWPDDNSSNPVNALKTLLYRIRSMLEPLFGELQPILAQRGAYLWNPAVGCDLDTDRFEALCAQASDESLSSESRMDLYRSALSLYQGDLLPKLDLLENVEVPLMYAGVPKAERRQRAREVLEQVGLGDKLHHLPNQLSGGQQQRVSIARALAGRPAVILADEPTGALDSHTSREVLGMLQDLHRQGNTVVLITHDNSIAVQAQRIIRLEDGHVVYDGDARAPEAVVTPGLRGGVSS